MIACDMSVTNLLKLFLIVIEVISGFVPILDFITVSPKPIFT